MADQLSLDNPTMSVSQLVDQIQSKLMALNPIVVQGEIASYTRSGLGHQYFELKDDKAKIRCVVFRGSVRGLPELSNGLMVKIHSRANIYAPQGSLQLKVDRLEALGDGLLQIRFEKLKRKLAAEGLFDEERKRELPRFPERIALITSPNAAAYHDVRKTLQLTWPLLRVDFLPVSVQGPASAGEIAKALRFCRQREIAGRCDLILLVRGGGSLDDLWSFNEEIVVRACADSLLPVVTGIGHEIDFTLCDFAADHRGATPTAAAAAISPGRDWLSKHLRGSLTAAASAVEARFGEHRSRFRLRQQQLRAHSPKNEIDRLRQSIDLWQSQAKQMTSGKLWQRRERVQGLKNEVVRLHPALMVHRRLERLGVLAREGRRQIGLRLDGWGDRHKACSWKLPGLHPRRQLDQARARVRHAEAILRLHHPSRALAALARRCQTASQGARRGGAGLEQMRRRLGERLLALKKELSQAHPDKILSKGYARITDSSGTIVRTKARALSLSALTVRVSDGQFLARPEPEPAEREPDTD